MTDPATESLVQHLAPPDQFLVAQLVSMMQSDAAALEKVRTFLTVRLTGGHVVDLKAVADDMRLQACIDCLVIGLLSGDIKRAEIKKLVQ